ncbi:MAG: head GIN domain-containing protein [Burkholderiaceae bacterium]
MNRKGQSRRIAARQIAGVGLLACLPTSLTATSIDDVRQPGSFDRLSVGIPAQVNVVLGSKSEVRLSAEKQVLDSLAVSVADGELQIRSTKGYSTQQAVNIVVMTPSLKAVNGHGAVSLQIDKLHADNFIVRGADSADIQLNDVNLRVLMSDLSGSSSMTLAGQVASQQVKLSDSASYDAENLTGQSAVLKVSGAADAVVRVSDQLDVTIKGAGSVEYIGDPVVKKKIGEAASLDQR